MSGQAELFRDDQVFAQPVVETIFPAWFRVGKTTPITHTRRVAQGRHPFGQQLGPEDRTCGECAFAYSRRVAKTYWKCSKARATSGLATDLRKRWRACVLFEAKQ